MFVLTLMLKPKSPKDPDRMEIKYKTDPRSDPNWLINVMKSWESQGNGQRVECAFFGEQYGPEALLEVPKPEFELTMFVEPPPTEENKPHNAVVRTYNDPRPMLKTLLEQCREHGMLIGRAVLRDVSGEREIPLPV